MPVNTLSAVGTEFVIDGRTKTIRIHGHNAATIVGMRLGMKALTVGKERPRLIGTTWRTLEGLITSLSPQQRFCDIALTEAGHPNVLVGGVSVVALDGEPESDDDVEDILDAMSVGSSDNIAYVLDESSKTVVAKILFIQ